MAYKTLKQNKYVNAFMILLGTFILAVSVEFFIIPYNILSGGVAGIAVALEPFFHIDKTLLANILTVGLFMVGFVFLGKDFMMKTFLSSLAYPVFTTLLSKLPQAITVHPMLASFYAGLIGGIGIGIVMRAGATTGGMDIPPMIVNKAFGVKISTGILVTDTCTVLLGVVAYGINAALVGLVSVFATTYAVNKALSIGEGSEAKSVQIISSEWEDIVHAIDEELKRDVTLIPCKGGFQQDDHMIILCVVSDRQYNKLLALIRSIDDRAFTITTEAADMHGEGFSYASPHI